MDDMTKKADNTFIERKVKISDIDELIDIERANLKKINSLYDSAYSLNKSINTCVSLLYTSIKGRGVQNILDNISNESKNDFRKMTATLDQEEQEIKKRLDNLYDKRESLLSEEKKNKDE